MIMSKHCSNGVVVIKFILLLLFSSSIQAAAAAAATQVIKDGLLPNGNFEWGPKASDLHGRQVVWRYGIPQWEISGFVEYIQSGQKQDDMLLVVPEGAHAVRLGNEASIKQKLQLIKGESYSITFSTARTCAQDERLNVSVMPDSDVFPIQTIYSSSGWDSYAWAFKAEFDQVEFVIHNPGVEDDPACGPLVDSVAIRILNPPGLTKYNLLKNGDMEEGPYVFPNAPWGILIPPYMDDDDSPLPAWMVVSLKAVKYIDSASFYVPSGKRAVELIAGMESTLAQVARTTPGKAYVLSFSVGDSGSGCRGSMVVKAFAAPQTLEAPYESQGKGGFKRAELRFTAVANRTQITFFSTKYHTRSDGMLCGPVIDDVSLLSVRSGGGRRMLSAR